MWFEPSSYTVNESVGTVALTIRTNVAGGPPVGSVRFGTSDGTAIGKIHTLILYKFYCSPYFCSADSDYTSTTMYEVSFVEGSFTTTLEVPIIDNSIAEEEEIFYGSLATIGDASVVITQERAEIHIIDNDGM